MINIKDSFLKKVLCILLIVFIFGCNKTKEVFNEDNFISYDVKVSDRLHFEKIINEFFDKYNNEYTVDQIANELNNSYLIIYDIYKKDNVEDALPIVTFSVYFNNKNDEAIVMDLLYTFPIVENESEENLKFEYELYKNIIRALLSENDEKNTNNIIKSFHMTSYSDYKKIINNKINYNFREISMGENKEDYMSTLFVNYNKSITFEYHDIDFVEEKY